MKRTHLIKLFAVCVGMIPLVSQAATITKVAAGSSYILYLRSDGSLWAVGSTPISTAPHGFQYKVVTNDVVWMAAGGQGSSFFVLSDGSLWGGGLNSSGELGDGTTTSTNVAQKIVAGGVTAVALGGSSGGHSLFVQSDGSLWGMGHNSSGQLGNGTHASTNSPQKIVSSNVTAVVAGFSHTLFLESDGSLWGMGDGGHGQLGIGTTMSTNTPQKIVASDVIAIAAGGRHSLFLQSDGSLWGMGNNSSGQLGIGTTNSVVTPVKIISSNVTAIAAGILHSLFLKSDGSLWGMGNNGWGQSGDGFPNMITTPQTIVSSNVVAIASGAHQNLFVKTDGSLWGIGSGQFGNGIATHISPRLIVPPTSIPSITGVNFSEGDMVLTGSHGMTGETYYVLTSTNVSLPLNQWTRITTNTLSVRANFTIVVTNAIISNAAQQFYVLQLR